MCNFSTFKSKNEETNLAKTVIFENRKHSPAKMLVVIKLPYLKSTILCSKLSKGMGHNYYGEPA